MYIKCSCRKYLIRPVYPWSKLAKIPASTRQRGQAKLERLTRKGGTSCNSTHGIKATTGEAPEIDMLSLFKSAGHVYISQTSVPGGLQGSTNFAFVLDIITIQSGSYDKLHGHTYHFP